MPLIAGSSPKAHGSNVNHRAEFPGTLEECWAAAREFVDAPRPQIDGVIGLAGQCAVYLVGDDP